MDRPDDLASPWDMLRRSTSPLHPRFRRLDDREPPAGLPHGFTLGTAIAPGNDWTIFAEEANARGKVGSDHRVVILYEPATAGDAERFAASLSVQLFDGRVRLILCGGVTGPAPKLAPRIDVGLDPRHAGEIEVPADADTLVYLTGRCVFDPLALERICRMTRISRLIAVPLVQAPPGRAVSAPAVLADWPADRPYRTVRGLNIAVPAVLAKHVGPPSAEGDFAFRCYQAGAYFVPVFVPELSNDGGSEGDLPTRTSIIVDARRRSWGVGRTVASLYAQGARDLEICVWGGGLAVGLFQSLNSRSSSNVRRIDAAGLEGAIAATRGEFVGLIEAGDAIGAGTLAETVAHFEGQGDLVATRMREARTGSPATWRRIGGTAILPMTATPQFILFRRAAWMRRAGAHGNHGADLLRGLWGLGAVDARQSAEFKPGWRVPSRGDARRLVLGRAKAELVTRGLDRYWDPASPPDRLVRKPGSRLVVFWPDYSRSNAYQRLLYGSGDNDTEYVSGAIDVAIGAARSLGGEQVVFHLHWTNRIFRLSEDGAVVQVEADAFVDKLRQFKQLGGTIVWTIHNTVSHDTSHYDAEITFAKAIVALADRIHLHSARSVDEVETHFVIPREKLRIARHGNYLGAYADFVPRDVARRDLGLGEDDDVLLFTGALRRYKGLDSLLSAFERMLPQRPSVRLVLAGSTKAGDEPLLEGVSAAARSRILLVDRFLDNDEMQLYFRAADAGVYPYDEVLTSGSIMLAQSFGLPVVAPDFGMIVEAVDSAAGALYDRRDPAGLEAALERVLAAKSSGKIEAMRTAAVAAARRNSWQPFARTVLG